MTASLGCLKKHRSVSDIYNSGQIGDTLDWIMHHNSAKWEYDTFYYKPDTSLYLVTAYRDSIGKDKAITMFFYKNKVEGLATVFLPGGVKIGETMYKNNLNDGLSIHYYTSGKMKWKLFYEMGKQVYIVNYDEQGKKIDSLHSKK